MADWTQVAGLAAQLINAGYTEKQANDIANKAYAQAGANLARQRADFEAIPLPTYSEVDPNSTAVPDTELKGIQVDPTGRQAQLEEMAGLRNLIDSGGLTLADKKALNDIAATTNRSAQANRNALANQFAARGQLGSGAQLAMELQGNQDAAMRANAAGESAAAQAQARALQAMAQRASMGRTMTEDAYNKDAAAARAADLIKARNMSARTDAIRGNNAVRGQAFDDRMGVAKGKNAISDQERALMMDQGRFGYGNAKAEGALRGDVISKAAGLFGGKSNANDSAKQNDTVGNPDDWNQFTSSPPMVQADDPNDPHNISEDDK